MRLFALLFALALTLQNIALADQPNQNQVLKISSGLWPPFTGESLPDNGEISKLVREAFLNQDIQVEFRFMPWARALKEVQEGRVQASILWRKTPKRQEKLYFSDAVAEVDIVFFHHKSRPIQWETLNDLKKYHIGAVRGFKYQSEFDAMLGSGELTVELMVNDQQNIRKLLHGRIDLAPIVQNSGNWMINHNLTEDESKWITHHPKPLAHQALHLVASKQWKDSDKLISRFNKGLANIKQSPK